MGWLLVLVMLIGCRKDDPVGRPATAAPGLETSVTVDAGVLDGATSGKDEHVTDVTDEMESLRKKLKREFEEGTRDAGTAEPSEIEELYRQFEDPPSQPARKTGP